MDPARNLAASRAAHHDPQARDLRAMLAELTEPAQPGDRAGPGPDVPELLERIRDRAQHRSDVEQPQRTGVELPKPPEPGLDR